MKFDLVMWTKNAGSSFPRVLGQIERVIPKECVNNKIAIDDNSLDHTKGSLLYFDWQVYSNKKGGISAGANQALGYVETDWFCSFEQDVVLHEDWFNAVTSHMEKGVGCVQGTRRSSLKAMRVMEEYHFQRKPTLYVSMDNNLFCTSVLRELGGFPDVCPVCTDTILRHKMVDKGYQWIILDDIVSSHLRSSVRKSVSHAYKQSMSCTRTSLCSSNVGVSLLRMAKLFATSPVRGVDMAWKKRYAPAMVYYPYLRFNLLLAEIHRKGKELFQ